MNSTTISNKTTKHPHYYMFLFMIQSGYLQEMYFFSGLFFFLLHYSFPKKVTDNAGLYHYAGNNPVRYMDQDGREDDQTNIIGIFSHIAIEKWLMKEFHGTDCEQLVINGGKNGEGDGRYDYRYQNEIYEIKPITQHTNPEAKKQLQRYVSNLPGIVKGTSLLSQINGKK